MNMKRWFILFLLSLTLMLLPTVLIAEQYGWRVPSNQFPIEIQIISSVTLVVGSICVLIVVACGTVAAKYGKDET